MTRTRKITKIVMLLLLMNTSFILIASYQSFNMENLSQTDDPYEPTTSDVPQGIIAMWSGTLDSIPDGWALCNGSSGTPDLTGRFVYGTKTGEAAGGMGGNLEHNHTYSQVPTHSHGLTDPMHYHDINATTKYVMENPAGVPWNVCGTINPCSTTFSPSQISLDYRGNANCETNNRTSLPPYYELAFIQKIDTNITIPKGLIMVWPFDLDVIPENWALCNGSDNTPNMTGRFARCVDNGIDPGNKGGYREHNHTYAQVPRHTHTITDSPGHQHVCLYDTIFIEEAMGSGIEVHSICATPLDTPMQTEPALSGLTVDDAGLDVCTTNNASSMPPYTEIAYVMCEADTSALPRGMIGMWGGSQAAIPTKYEICDGTIVPINLTNRFAISVMDGVNPGSKGGQLTHNHSYVQIPRHNHDITDLTHTHTVYYEIIETLEGPFPGKYWDPDGIEFCQTQIGLSGASIDPTGITTCYTDNSSSLPPYYKLAFIQHENSPPEAQSLSITSSPDTEDDLTASYTYFDIESDPEGPTQIRWYKDDVLQSQFNDQMNVLSIWTNKTQTWYYTVRPHDGYEFGALSTSPSASIANGVPSVSGESLGSSPKTTDEDLTLQYTFDDPDGDDDESWIRWYKGATEQTQFENQTSVSNVWTNKSDSWYAEIYPHDGAAWGIMSTASAVNIINSAPVISNVLISPGAPGDDESLSVAYDYDDADKDSETDTLIIWYKDGVEQLKFENETIVSNIWTNATEAWNATVSASDGFERSNTAPSQTVYIDNNIPSVDDLEISPTEPITSDDISITYTWSDADGDGDQSWIRWFADGVRQTAYDNETTLPSSATTYGEDWNVTILAYDGKVWNSSLVESATVTIQNSLPVISNVQIIPSNPTVEQDLTITYIYNDADGHSESGTVIKWYKNGVHQSQFDGQTSISASEVSAGDDWYVVVNGSDGIGVASGTSSATVSVTGDGGSFMDYIIYIVAVAAAIMAVVVVARKRKGIKSNRDGSHDSASTDKTHSLDDQSQQQGDDKSDSKPDDSSSIASPEDQKDEIIKEKASVCSNCGKVIEGGSGFCPNCGQKQLN